MQHVYHFLDCNTVYEFINSTILISVGQMSTGYKSLSQKIQLKCVPDRF